MRSFVILGVVLAVAIGTASADGFYYSEGFGATHVKDEYAGYTDSNLFRFRFALGMRSGAWAYEGAVAVNAPVIRTTTTTVLAALPLRRSAMSNSRSSICSRCLVTSSSMSRHRRLRLGRRSARELLRPQPRRRRRHPAQGSRLDRRPPVLAAVLPRQVRPDDDRRLVSRRWLRLLPPSRAAGDRGRCAAHAFDDGRRGRYRFLR